MAKMGEGDQRWIVEDRADGQNVNQWHWSEKDCMNWCKHKLAELFDSKKLVDDGQTSASTSGVPTVEGEAFLNVRKKKLIPSYELKVTIPWEGEVDGNKVTGKIVFPYIAEENHDEDPELQVRPEQDDAASRRLKDVIYERRREILFPAVQRFVEDFHAGKPAGHEENGNSLKSTVVDHTKEANNKEKQNDVAKPKAAASPAAPSTSGVKRGTRDIKITETFYASANDLYDCLTNENRMKAFTQSEAKFENKVGGKFCLFGGSIEGTNLELAPGKCIVQDWRFNTWPDDLYSKVTISISEPEPGHTTVQMSQTGVPEEDKFGNHDVVGTTENGWRQLIFYRIRAVFGFGL